MKIYNEIILQWNDKTNRFDTVYEDSFDYDGTVDYAAKGDDPVDTESLAKKLGLAIKEAISELDIPKATIVKTGMLAGLVSVFKSVSNLSDAIGDSFGAIGNNTTEFKNSLIDAKSTAIGLGYSFEEAASSTKTLSANLGIGIDEAADLSKSTMDTARTLGISVDEATNLTTIIARTTGTSAKGAKNFLKQTAALAKASKVAPSAVMEDIAGSSEDIAKFTKGTGENIAKAAIKARQLGMGFSSVAKVASGLLDIESSIGKQMEASVLLGRNINLNRAAQLSLTGDLEGMMNEVLTQVGGEAEWNRLNAIQRDALADAVGVGVDEMSKMVKMSGKGAEEIARMTDMDIGDMIPSDAMSNLTWFINKVKQLGAILMGSVAKSFQKVGGGAGGIEKTMEKVLSWTEKAGQQIADWIVPLTEGGNLSGKMGTIWKDIKDKVNELTVGPLKSLSDTFDEIVDKQLTKFDDRITGVKDQFKKWLPHILKASIIFAAILGTVMLLGPMVIKSFVAAPFKGLAAGLSSLGAAGSGAVTGVGVLVIAMAGLAVGIYALSKAIEYGEKGFKIFFDVVGGFVLDVMKELKELIIALAPHVVKIADVVGTQLNKAFVTFKELIIGVVNAMGNFISGSLDAMTDTFERLAAVGRTGGLGSAAIGIVEIAAAIAGFGVGSAAGGLGAWVGAKLGGDPVEKFTAFSKLGPGLTSAGKGIQMMAEGLVTLKEITIDKPVLNTLKSVAEMSAGGGITGNITMQVAGLSDGLGRLGTKVDSLNTSQTEINKRTNELLSTIISSGIPVRRGTI